jgi:Periplasmic lysozyme inhibitor of I-type lysozyme
MPKAVALTIALLLAISACTDKPVPATAASSTSEPDMTAAEEVTIELDLNSATTPFRKELSMHGVSFVVAASNDGSINTLTITPIGLTEVNDAITREIDGTVSDAEIADINADRSPEIYVWVNSAGSGSYAAPIGYSANNKKSLSEIYFPPVSEDPVNSKGYMGHDEFRVVENSIVQRFPIYNDGDSNAKPTGKTRQLQFKLTPGEGSWVMTLEGVSEF